MCDKCANCNCGYVSNTTINSEQAGRDGLSSYELAVKSGKFIGTESEFIEWSKGSKGDKGDKGNSGDTQITLYSKNNSNIIPPNVVEVVNPEGWSTQIPQLLDGEYRWIITSFVNYDRTILLQPWSTPNNDLAFVDDIVLTSDVFI